MTHTLTDRAVLVIGRSSGIARAITLAARDAGARVIVAGREPGALAAAYGDPTISVEHADVTDESSVAALAARVGSIDHVVSTASARARGAVADLAAATVLASLNTKVVGAILLAKHFAPTMATDGSFVFFSGASARRPSIGMLAVSATNAAVDAVTRSLAVELAPIRVNAIAPGTIDTGAYDALGDTAKAQLFAERERRSPARRSGTPDDVAATVIYALTNRFVTGQSLLVDGGETLV